MSQSEESHTTTPSAETPVVTPMGEDGAAVSEATAETQPTVSTATPTVAVDGDNTTIGDERSPDPDATEETPAVVQGRSGDSDPKPAPLESPPTAEDTTPPSPTADEPAPASPTASDAGNNSERRRSRRVSVASSSPHRGSREGSLANTRRSLSSTRVIPQTLHEMFIAYCTFGGGHATEMGNSQLVKMVREAGLLTKHFNNTDVDIVFNKTKVKGKRTIPFEAFEIEVLPKFAKKKNMEVDEIIEMVMATGGPKVITAVAHAEAPKLGEQTERTQTPERRPAPKKRPVTPPPPAAVEGELGEKLKDVFTAFSSFGGASPTDMGNSQLAKLVREAKLLEKYVFTMTDVDLVFNKTKVKGKRTIPFEAFRDVILPDFAIKKDTSVESVAEAIVATGGPKVVATHAEAPQFNEKPKEEISAKEFSAKQRKERLMKAQAMLKAKNTQPPPPPAAVEGELGEKLNDVFTAFSSFGGASPTDMGNSQLAKLVREAQMLDKFFTMTDVDLVFNKTKQKGKRSIPYEAFRDGIVPAFAKKKGVTNDEIAELIIATGGPKAVGTQAENVRFFKKSPTDSSSTPSKPFPLSADALEDDRPEPQQESKYPLVVGALDHQPRAGVLGALYAAASAGDGCSPNRSGHRLSNGSLSPSASTASPHRNKNLTAEEAHKLIEQHNQEVKNMKKNREEREKARIEQERVRMEETIKQREEALAEQRRQREEALKERLEKLRQRREARELEFLVGERRAHQVLQSKNLVDEIEARYQEKVAKEDEERAHVLEERRARMRQPVVISADEATEKRREIAKKAKQRSFAMREQLREVEHTTPAHHQGKSYESAQEEYIKAKNKHDDARHQRLYKHVKMAEYGKLVAQLPSDPTPLLKEHKRRLAEGLSPSAQSPPPLASGETPSHVRAGLTIAERTKAGNNYLRTAIAEKKPLPPGLKLQPIDTSAQKEEARRKDRKKKGDQYLRDIQQDPNLHLQRGQKTVDPLEEEYAQIAELKRLRHRATTKEVHLKSPLKPLPGSPASKYYQGDDDQGGGHEIHDTEEQLAVEQDETEQYLDVVKTKMELLKKVEVIRKGKKKSQKATSGGDSGNATPHR